MRPPRADYTGIAPSYDDRYRQNQLSGVAAALGALVDLMEQSRIFAPEKVAPRRVLEVGCGTGHWLCRLHPQVKMIVGLDLSAAMLARARGKEGALCLVQGDGCRLPFADAAYELVFCVNALVHFADQRRFVAEAHRVLAPGGALAIVGGDPRGRRGRWYVYDYFDGAYEIDVQRCPSWDTVEAWMAEEGFAPITRRVAEHIAEPMVGRQVLDSPFVRKQGCSTLALLSDEAYAAGLRKIEQAIAVAEARGTPAVFAADLTLEMVVGRKSRSRRGEEAVTAGTAG